MLSLGSLSSLSSSVHPPPPPPPPEPAPSSSSDDPEETVATCKDEDEDDDDDKEESKEEKRYEYGLDVRASAAATAEETVASRTSKAIKKRNAARDRMAPTELIEEFETMLRAYGESGHEAKMPMSDLHSLMSMARRVLLVYRSHLMRSPGIRRAASPRFAESYLNYIKYAPRSHRQHAETVSRTPVELVWQTQIYGEACDRCDEIKRSLCDDNNEKLTELAVRVAQFRARWSLIKDIHAPKYRTAYRALRDRVIAFTVFHVSRGLKHLKDSNKLMKPVAPLPIVITATTTTPESKGERKSSSSSSSSSSTPSKSTAAKMNAAEIATGLALFAASTQLGQWLSVCYAAFSAADIIYEIFDKTLMAQMDPSERSVAAWKKWKTAFDSKYAADMKYTYTQPYVLALDDLSFRLALPLGSEAYHSRGLAAAKMSPSAIYKYEYKETEHKLYLDFAQPATSARGTRHAIHYKDRTAYSDRRRFARDSVVLGTYAYRFHNEIRQQVEFMGDEMPYMLTQEMIPHHLARIQDTHVFERIRLPLVLQLGGGYYVHEVYAVKCRKTCPKKSGPHVHHKARLVAMDDIDSALCYWGYLVHSHHGDRLDSGDDIKERWIKKYMPTIK